MDFCVSPFGNDVGGLLWLVGIVVHAGRHVLGSFFLEVEVGIVGPIAVRVGAKLDRIQRYQLSGDLLPGLKLHGCAPIEVLVSVLIYPSPRGVKYENSRRTQAGAEEGAAGTGRSL